LVQEQATDLGVSALDRGQLDDSRALIKVKILFGLHRDICAQKTSKIGILYMIFPKNGTRGKKLSATKNDHLNE
jgi:hypothetical protein